MQRPPERWSPSVIFERRRALFGSPVNNPEPAPSRPGEDGTDASLPAPWGLALSGGGIRSATFALGVLQAIARARVGAADEVSGPRPGGEAPAVADSPVQGPSAETSADGFAASLLSRFDYLSTVSGGGYLGGFLATLFLPGRLGASPQAAGAAVDALAEAGPPGPTAACIAAADSAVQALRIDPPGRIHSDRTYTPATVVQAPLAWLRENGRYLAPTGAGDLGYAASLGLRNWIGVQYVFGTVLMVIFALVALLRAAVMQWMPWMEATAFENATRGPIALGSLWWSPLFAFALLPFVLWALPVGLAFWLTYPTGAKHSGMNRAVLGLFVVVLGLWVLVVFDDVPLRAWLWWISLVVLSLSLLMHFFNLRRKGKPLTVIERRVLSTRQLTSGLGLTIAVLVFALVDTLGQSFYLASIEARDHTGPLAATALASALVWLAKKFAASLGDSKSPSWIKKVPLSALGGAAGMLILLLMAVLWSYAVDWVVWAGEKPNLSTYPGNIWWIRVMLLGGVLTLAWLSGQFPGFINLSSLQSFYAARLTRAYLGASNGGRFLGNTGPQALSLSAAEPMQNDEVTLDKFVDRQSGGPSTLAPLHLINVTLNKTVDPAEQLVQRDRKGQPMAVSPLGFAVDGILHTSPNARAASEIERPLSLGQWIGTSGAAFSTGIGRETSLGMSLLMGAANVRLGTWWQSGAAERGVKDRGLARIFKTQAYLLDEFTARFYGLRRKWQYLSDGGHFENTALYELLRPERKLSFIIAVDAGADPHYEFGDLANLIRLARIDLQAEVEVDRGAARAAGLAGIFGVPEDFSPGATRSPAGDACALLLRVRQADTSESRCWIVLIKPHVGSESPADVTQYAFEHPRFPQEATTDQFFDEAQWESYRKLGLASATQVLSEPVVKALACYIGSARARPSLGEPPTV